MIKLMGFHWTLILLIVGAGLLEAAEDRFPLSIIHINDFHARYEPTDNSGGICDETEECIGGYARSVYTVKQLLEQQKDLNPIYINAGDSFQGTLWYNIGRWNVTQQFLNMLPAEAMTLGNHEFDHGVEGVVPFLKTVDTKMLVANMDCAHEPLMEGLYEKSMIIERSGRKIGLIGVILETTYDLANTGKLIFRNESDAIREEAALLKQQGANIIIVISHCGYEVDKTIASVAGDVVDVIVGSHSHTFLYTGDNWTGPDKPRGDYPTEVIHSSGHRVLIVQAGAYAKYVGNLTVYFNAQGDVVDFEGAPIFMSADVPEDEDVVAAIQPWKEYVDETGKVVIGRSVVDLTKSDCSYQECNLGNFVCDAFVHSFTGLTPFDQKAWTNVSIALAGTGGLRVPILRGNITYAHMVSMSPFSNTLMAFNLPGSKIIEALEYSVSKVDLENGVTSSYIMLQVSGLKVTYDFTKPVNSRVVSVHVRCADCPVPVYEPFEPTKSYRIVASDFLVGGGDGYTMLTGGTDVQPSVTDIDALISYAENISPIYTGHEDEFVVLALKPWQVELEEQSNRIVATSRVPLQQSECSRGECNLGNLYTDAMIHAFVKNSSPMSKNWSNVTIALTSQGNFRVPIPAGDISYKQLVAMCPWENRLYALSLQGEHLWQLLEDSVGGMNASLALPTSKRFLQVSGLRITYNLTSEPGQRIVSLRARCAHCDVPEYRPLKLDQYYRLVVMEYLANGKNGFALISDHAKDLELGPFDLDALMDYMSVVAPITAGLEQRIQFVKT
ncbi:hypothetical protein ACLKA6_016182 [Drosophila palustris]